MSDQDLRALERAASSDPAARSSLIVARARAGLCPWCGGPGTVHAFTSERGVHYERPCCCFDCFAQHSRDGLCPECPAAMLRQPTERTA